MVTSVLLLAVSLAPLARQSDPAATAAVPFVLENGPDTQVTKHDGVVRLNPGTGWLRTAHLYVDYDLTFEFRAVSAATIAAMAVRTWGGEAGWPRTGYRIALTGSEAGRLTDVSAPAAPAVANVSNTAADVQWHSVRLTCKESAIIIELDGARSEHQVSEPLGVILFTAQQDGLDIRDLQLSEWMREDGKYRKPGSPGAHDVEAAKRIRGSSPNPLRALDHNGTVRLEAVVLDDGSVGRIHVVIPVDRTLEKLTVKAVSKWRFTPARFRGAPVASIVGVEMTFHSKTVGPMIIDLGRPR